MPRLDYKRCRLCGEPSFNVGPLSHTRLCGGCATERVAENLDAMKSSSGPAFAHWRRRCLAAFGVFGLDSVPVSKHTGSRGA